MFHSHSSSTSQDNQNLIDSVLELTNNDTTLSQLLESIFDQNVSQPSDPPQPKKNRREDVDLPEDSQRISGVAELLDYMCNMTPITPDQEQSEEDNLGQPSSLSASNDHSCQKPSEDPPPLHLHHLPLHPHHLPSIFTTSSPSSSPPLHPHHLPSILTTSPPSSPPPPPSSPPPPPSSPPPLHPHHFLQQVQKVQQRKRRKKVLKNLLTVLQFSNSTFILLLTLTSSLTSYIQSNKLYNFK